MDITEGKVMLYTSQSKIVAGDLMQNGVTFSKRAYVEKKYEESAAIFVQAYSWFVSEAIKYVPRPEGAEYPYWVFPDLYNVEQHGGDELLRMQVPLDEVIFFDMFDWNRILSLQYLGETAEEEKAFREKIADYGIKRESDILLTGFYPSLKREVQESWKKLFRHHEKIKGGNTEGVNHVQAALWCFKKEWLIKV